jgi:hypothetical protein
MHDESKRESRVHNGGRAGTGLLRAAAHHEAGHAVAAWWHGMKFRRVTIKPDGDSLGHVLLRQFPKWFRPDLEFDNPRVRLRLEHHIIVSFAGQLAEAKFRGRRPRWGMDGDNQQAVEMAYRVCGSRETAEAYLHYCLLASRDLVNVRWREIQALAAALLERNTLGYQSAAEVIFPGSKALRASLKAILARKRRRLCQESSDHAHRSAQAAGGIGGRIWPEQQTV